MQAVRLVLTHTILPRARFVGPHPPHPLPPRTPFSSRVDVAVKSRGMVDGLVGYAVGAPFTVGEQTRLVGPVLTI